MTPHAYLISGYSGYGLSAPQILTSTTLRNGSNAERIIYNTNGITNDKLK